MEHGDPVRLFHLVVAVSFITWITVAPTIHAAEPQLVLVASTNSAVSELTAEDVRRLYLGIPIEVGGHALKPLRNNTDDLVQEVFMQEVMFMSTPAYERQILSRVYRQGGRSPPVFTEMNELVEALKQDPDAVTYMFRKSAMAMPSIKIIGELGWTEN